MYRLDGERFRALNHFHLQEVRHWLGKVFQFFMCLLSPYHLKWGR